MAKKFKEPRSTATDLDTFLIEESKNNKPKFIKKVLKIPKIFVKRKFN
jgi:hypothetical protein